MAIHFQPSGELMQKNSAESFIASAVIWLLAWLSIGSVIGSALSFVNALPTRWPALVYFAGSPLQWRLLFFLAGCLALTTAWFLHKKRFAAAFAVVTAFAVFYIPVFPIVWGQHSFARILAGVAVVSTGYLLVVSRRQKV